MTKIDFNPALFQPTGGGNTTQKVQDSGFGDVLKKAVSEVNETMQEAGVMVNGLMAGEHSNIHETMIAMEKSSLSFRMLTKAQSKVIDAYKEVLRLQL